MRFSGFLMLSLLAFVTLLGKASAQKDDDADKKKRITELRKEINDLQKKMDKLSTELAGLDPVDPKVETTRKLIAGKWESKEGLSGLLFFENGDLFTQTWPWFHLGGGGGPFGSQPRLDWIAITYEIIDAKTIKITNEQGFVIYKIIRLAKNELTWELVPANKPASEKKIQETFKRIK